MPAPLVYVALGAAGLWLLGKGRQTVQPSSGVLPVQTELGTTADGQGVKVVEGELGPEVKPLPGEPVKPPPTIKTAPRPPVTGATQPVLTAEQQRGLQQVQGSMTTVLGGIAAGTVYGTAVKTFGSTAGTPIVKAPVVPKIEAETWKRVGSNLGSIW